MGLKIQLAESFGLTLLLLRDHQTGYKQSESLSPPVPSLAFKYVRVIQGLWTVLLT